MKEIDPNDSSDAALILSGFITSPEQERIVLSQLLKTIAYVEEIAGQVWSVTLYSNIFRLNVGRVEVYIVGEDFVRLNCIGKYGKGPFIGSEYEESHYKTVQVDQCAFCGDYTEFDKVSETLWPYHKGFVDKVAITKGGKPFSAIFKKSNFQGLIDYAKSKYSERQDVKNANDIGEIELRYIEGYREIRQINDYGRNRAARDKCLEYYGAKCAICGFDSKSAYGISITEIIHVHHIVAIAGTDKAHSIDPVKDLIPLCPNCHAIIHSKKPNYTVDEIRNMVNATSR